MAKERTSVCMQAQIKGMAEQGYSLRSIARVLKLSRKTVRKYLERTPEETSEPAAWMGAVDWDYVREEVYGTGTTIKQVHAQVCPEVSYVNFWRAFREQVPIPMNEEQKRQVAIFRYGVIGDFVSSLRLDWGGKASLLREKCSRTWQIPFSVRTRLSPGTIRLWIRAYEKGGRRLEALYPQSRSDRGLRRVVDEKTALGLVGLRREVPKGTVRDLIRTARECGLLGPDQYLSESTVWRILKHEGLMDPQMETPVEGRQQRTRVRCVHSRDRNVFIQWRRSNDRTLWAKAVAILENSSDSIDQISAKVEKSIGVVKKWIEAFNHDGIEGLNPRRKKRQDKRSANVQERAKRLLEILHQRPSAFGINRSNWNQASLALAYEAENGDRISKSTVSRLVRKSGYRWKKAKRVLSSPDPLYREKVELLLNTLHSLKPGELFFFVDELGPLRVKRYGGRVYVPKRTSPTVPQVQPRRGAVILAAALSATTNQITWIYSDSKDTSAMIDLAELLFNQYHDAGRIFLTWDAASWHSSDALSDWLDKFNAETRGAGGPVVELVPLPTSSQFLNVLEAVFSGMKRAVIHNSDYPTTEEMKRAISRHFSERNAYFKDNPRRAGKKIWEVDFFEDSNNLTSGNYREW